MLNLRIKSQHCKRKIKLKKRKSSRRQNYFKNIDHKFSYKSMEFWADNKAKPSCKKFLKSQSVVTNRELKKIRVLKHKKNLKNGRVNLDRQPRSSFLLTIHQKNKAKILKIFSQNRVILLKLLRNLKQANHNTSKKETRLTKQFKMRQTLSIKRQSFQHSKKRCDKIQD